MVVLLTALLKRNTQMYEAEDLKTRLQQQQQQSGEPGRRKRRQGPYDSSRQISQSSSRPSRSTRSEKPHQSEEIVTSSTDHSALERDNKIVPVKVSPQATKQPTLVELLQAGVERPPNGPPRLSSSHTPTQRTQSAVEFPDRPGYSGLPSRLIEQHTRPQTPSNASSDSSCIVQLLRCPRNTADVERRMWPPTSPNDAALPQSGSGPLIAEADSSNMPLDADLLNEMKSGSNSDMIYSMQILDNETIR
ncbi:uncharacterized protein LOC114828341 [Galendromus occidentalis]|uniref:Uncharacterized protein LOC114828341 n=1 Tax=Galendromus occidentalis TaxID=34638 RepID=A0AAJ7SFS3_9ACAR|nr:uncharacterized protein LOC114828341 [Galendromus occidentalis]